MFCQRFSICYVTAPSIGWPCYGFQNSIHEIYILDGNECRRANKLDKTIDSAILLTQSWLDVTIFTTWKLNQQDIKSLGNNFAPK